MFPFWSTNNAIHDIFFICDNPDVPRLESPFSPHTQNVTSKAATTLYALKVLKAHGLQGKTLWQVTRSTLIAKITPEPPMEWVYQM